MGHLCCRGKGREARERERSKGRKEGRNGEYAGHMLCMVSE